MFFQLAMSTKLSRMYSNEWTCDSTQGNIFDNENSVTFDLENFCNNVLVLVKTFQIGKVFALAGKQSDPWIC